MKRYIAKYLPTKFERKLFKTGSSKFRAEEGRHALRLWLANIAARAEERKKNDETKSEV